MKRLNNARRRDCPRRLQSIPYKILNGGSKLKVVFRRSARVFDAIFGEFR